MYDHIRILDRDALETISCPCYGIIAAEYQRIAAGHQEGLVSLGQVMLHANSFRRVLVNLIQNALEAMPQGGSLTLRGRQTDTQMQLQVSDTGIGMPAANCLLIFEPLYTTKPTGTGLGLYLVQEIVTAHGGEIAVQSAVGRGTTFTITLPRANVEETRPC